MYQSQFFSVAQTFSTEEWKSFKTYLNTKVREDSEIMLLYHYIQKYRNDLGDPNLELEKANKKLFKSKTRKNFQNLLSRLYNYALDFITHEEFKKDPREYALYKMLALNHRGLHAQASKQYLSQIKILDSYPIDLWNHYYQLRTTHELKFSDNRQRPLSDIHLYKLIIKDWSILKSQPKAYYTLDARHIEILKRTNLENTIQKLSETSEEDDTSYQIEKLCDFMCHMQEDMDTEIIIWLKKNQSILNPNLGVFFTVLLIQTYLRKLKAGLGLSNRLYEVIDLGLKNDWLTDHGKMTYQRFLMITSMGSFYKEENEMLEFTRKYKDGMEKGIREQAYLHAQAIIACFYGNYEQSISILNRTSYSNHHLSSHARVLNLINYYSSFQDDIDFVSSHIENTLAYHKRHSLKYSESHLKGVLQFCKIIQMLVLQKPLIDIRNTIQKSQFLVRRAWLDRHVKELSQ